MKNKSGKIAFSGIICALSVTILFIGSFLPFLEYSLPMAAGILFIPIVIEFGKKYAFTAFAASSIVALIIIPNKEMAVLFLLFFGFYPILKSVFESFNKKPLEWLAKYTVFNLTMAAVYFASTTILGIPESEFMLGEFLPVFLLLAGNVVFLFYDILISRMVAVYINVLRHHFERFLDK